ncbi:MAG: hypothetical protein ACRC33_01590 [Gemmataceae bacterium]
MSTSPPTPPSPSPSQQTPQEVTVVSHSTLLYWWPVWACGFLMAAITFFEGTLMSTVPEGTKASVQEVEVTADGKKERREILVTLANGKLPRASATDTQPADPALHMSARKPLGVLFFTVLLLVIVFTNIPLRGMWSVLIIIGAVTLSLILHLAGLWDIILRYVRVLDVRVNMGGYLFFSSILFVIWVLTIVFFDRRVYIVFTPGQFRVCTEIGGGEKVFDTMGMKMEKQQSDFFRHTLLGLGAGDLIVKTSGATNEHFDLHNVLWINWKVQRIEDMLGKKKVMESR